MMVRPIFISLTTGTFIAWIERQWINLRKQKNNANEIGDDHETPAKRRKVGHETNYEDVKKHVITEELTDYQKVRNMFEIKDAKTWNEIPGQEMLRTKQKSHLHDFASLTSTTTFSKALVNFRLSGSYYELPSSQQEAYFSLFERVWSGNVYDIKAVTLARWGLNKDNEPLKVSIYESLYGNTLVAIALQQKRFDLARMLLQIAQVQYRPKEQKVNYFIDRDDSSDNDSERSSDGSDYYIASETIDNDYELGDVTHIPDEARTNITPLQILRRQVTFSHLLDKKTRDKLSSSNVNAFTGTALTMALMQDDFDAFVKILDLADEFDPGFSHREF
jgi:hypothetical protein